MPIKLSDQLAKDCIQLERRVGNWATSLKSKLKKVHRIVGQRWRTEAVKRVPVDTSTLKQRVISNVYEELGYIFVTEVGSNVPEYPVLLEFGSQFIAKGAVLRLGLSTTITDAQAIHTWPAKQEDAIAKTSFSRDVDGNLWNNPTKFTHAIVGGPQEQMPWLRPSFNSIRTWVIDQLNSTLEPPPA